MSVSYSRERESSLYLQPYDKDIIGKFLFDKEDIGGKKEALYTIWRTRRLEMSLTSSSVNSIQFYPIVIQCNTTQNKNNNVKGGIFKQ